MVLKSGRPTVDSGTHQFAFYYGVAPVKKQEGDSVVILDSDLIVRMIHVVRLSIGDMVVIFNGISTYECCIEKIDKKSLTARITSVIYPKILQPTVGVLLPLLKKVALEEAVYGCVESGISYIQLVITEKTNRSYRHEKELDRLQRIVIAACEQSKQFVIPEIRVPIALVDWLKCRKKLPLDTNAAHSLEVLKSSLQSGRSNDECGSLQSGMSSDERGSLYRDIFLFADPVGKPFLDVLNVVGALYTEQKNICFLVGPEGDLTNEEKHAVYASGAIGIRLTPTILRAQQAVIVLTAALVSSVFKK